MSDSKSYCSIPNLMKLHRKLRPSKFCFFFTLRQGTIVIAVAEMALTGFAILILALCAQRAEEIFMEAAADAAEGHHPVESISRWQFIYKNPHMEKGIQLGTLLLFLLYVALVLATTHMLTCMLLLYGAVKNFSNFVMPWITTVALTIIVSSLALVIFACSPYEGCRGQIYTVSVISLLVQTHSWAVVMGYYKGQVHKQQAEIVNNLLYAYEYEWGAVNPLYSPIPPKSQA